MRIALVTTARFSRLALELLGSIKTPTALHVFSMDPEVEAVAREVKAVFHKFNSIEELYVYKELESCDIGVIALDRDSDSIAVARILGKMGVPLIFIVLNTRGNRELAKGEGAGYVISLDEYIVGNILPVILMDSWVSMRIIDAFNLGVAVYRVWKRGVLGVKLGDFLDKLKGKPAMLMVYDKAGRIVMNGEHVVEQGDALILIAKYSELLEYISSIEKIFSKYEEYVARRYSEQFSTMPRTMG
ncbi:MAG: hypothetical protein QXP97_02050 [Desulfurococcus sp.]|uniref:hypothetical protein n=1 Tax=Desulfurococcus sp. TaxID=51678 RepID=UPI00316198B6